jgi:hypothetical protein
MLQVSGRAAKAAGPQGLGSKSLRPATAAASRRPVHNLHTDCEYRKSTITPLEGTPPKPVAVVTVGLPIHRLAGAQDGSSVQRGFLTSLSRLDMLQLRGHLDLDHGLMLHGSWQPVSKPAGKPTLVGKEGTLFWVEKLA